MTAPRFSVITAAYNAEATIVASVSANLGQEYDGWFELIVVDDGSTDGTAERLSSIRDARLTVVTLGTNRGRAAARNAAVARARGDYIVPCDADDRSRPGRLFAHAASIAEAPDAAAHFGNIWALTPAGDARHWPVMPSTADAVDEAFGRGRMGVAHGASAFRADWFRAVGGYDEAIRVAEDFDLFARGWSAGAFRPHPEFVLDCAVRSRFPRWGYWWDNERHRRAIDDRSRRLHAAPSGVDPHGVDPHGVDPRGIDPLDVYLARTSTPARKALELGRYSAHLANDLVRG
ncbi:glycosyltransferase [Leifsonia sp. Le1]|uniref:glycosyltransferase n=1 Tax=Leifsonia sp. Le1 TaxID=3404918 RepID=UPI003EBA2515